MKSYISSLFVVMYCLMSVSCTTTRSTSTPVTEAKSNYMPPPIFGYKDVLVWNSTNEPIQLQMTGQNPAIIRGGSFLGMPYRLDTESMNVEICASTTTAELKPVSAHLEYNDDSPLVQFKKNTQNMVVIHGNPQVSRIQDLGF